MKRFFILMSSVLVVLGMAGISHAILYSYDFSIFATEGQSFEGVTLDYMTLSSETGDLTYTGSYGAGLQADAGNGNTSDRYLSFSTPIDFISVRAGDGAGDSDAFSLYLYDFSTSSLIGRYDTPLFGGINEPEWYTLTVSVANIGYVVFDPGNSGVLPGSASGIGGVIVTDIAYNANPVPEPTTLLLLGGGLLGLVAMRNRRRK